MHIDLTEASRGRVTIVQPFADVSEQSVLALLTARITVDEQDFVFSRATTQQSSYRFEFIRA